MGVYIANMKMPITCDDCIVPLSKCDFLQRRADDCPLIEIDDELFKRAESAYVLQQIRYGKRRADE